MKEDFVIDVRNLKVEFPSNEKPIVAVNDISFEIKKGEILGIVGESGSGKSVTSLAVMGLIPAPGSITNGEIWFNEGESNVNLLEVSDKVRRSYRGKTLAMIFQEPLSSLNPVYNIGFQLTEAIRLHQNLGKSEAIREACALLQEVKLLPTDLELEEEYIQENIENITPRDYINQRKRDFLKRYPHQLSGGQLQRVMIAMAISCKPTILIADEPTTALDVTVQKTILDLLRDLCQAREMSMIFITHDLGVIAEIADSVAVMFRGKIVENGDINSILFNPQHPYTKGLLACRPPLTRRIKSLPTVDDFMSFDGNANGNGDGNGNGNFQEKTGQFEVVEIPLAEHEKRVSKLLSQEPLISVDNLEVGFKIKGVFGKTKRYFIAVNNVNFEVYPGETLGLVGESGCGKSTLARTLLNLIPALGGEIKFKGDSIINLPRGDKKLRFLRREMQVVFQNPYNSLNPRMSIGDAIMEPMTIHNVGGNKSKQREKVACLLEMVDLNPDSMNRYPHQFSGGQRQRICIARALALNPQFIICDESVSALDVSVQAQVLNLLKKLQDELGLTYLFISHDLSVVKFMSDRIMVMNRGKIEEIGSAEKIYNSPSKEYTKELINSIPTGGFDLK